jgi:hypothetical protein
LRTRALAEGGSGPRVWTRLAEGLTGDVRHDVVNELANLIYGENGNDVRMGKLRRGACLAQKAVAHFRAGGEFLREDLEGHRAIELDVLGQIYHTHSAPSQREYLPASAS